MDTLKIFNTTMNKVELVARVGRVFRSGPEDEVDMLWISYNACYKITVNKLCLLALPDEL